MLTREELRGKRAKEVILKCTVPVYIVMNGDSVRKVIVDDEALELDKAEIAWASTTGDADLDAARLKQAVAMAMDSDWPAWEFGW